MSDELFKSTGIIRVGLGPKNNDPQQSCPVQISFTPNADYSTPRSGCKQYALFVPAGEGDNCIRIPLCDSGKGIPISVQPGFPDLLAAATSRTLVEVEVVKRSPESGCQQSVLTLHAITIPAPDKQK